MNKIIRESAIFAFAALVAVSSFGQDRSVWRTSTDVQDGSRGSIVGTVSDVNDAANRLMLTPDDSASAQVVVTIDSLGTQFYGFGGSINGHPEIFIGSKGFSNLRAGDRLEVRGVGRGVGTLNADSVTLLGRPVPVGTTGVGDTRPLGSISTPSSSATTSSTTGNYGRIEGLVRQVNGDDNRIVVETDRREMITIRGNASTPVRYRNESYRIRDLEQGDRIRVDVDTTGGTTGEIRARTIEVVQSVQDRSGSTRGTSGANVTTISGKVTRVDRAANIAWVDNGRGEVRVDISGANDQTGRRVRASDFQVNDRVDMTGGYGANSDVFMATTVRWVDEVLTPSTPAPQSTSRVNAGVEPGAVTFYGAVTESLRNAPQLTIRDTKNNRSISVWVLDDFVIRTKSGGYTTADHLNENDSVMVKAYRTADGDYIAQTIRLR
ncbi:MAG: DUF5666 domain-containing protein [Acidobacteriota bacterium]